jgi:hypothetical protein
MNTRHISFKAMTLYWRILYYYLLGLTGVSINKFLSSLLFHFEITRNRSDEYFWNSITHYRRLTYVMVLRIDHCSCNFRLPRSK